MKVAVDGQALQTGSRDRGIGRYVLELCRALAAAGRGIDLHISLNLDLEDTVMAARELAEPIVGRENIHTFHTAAEGGEDALGATDRRRFSEWAVAAHFAGLAPDLALSASPFEGRADRSVPLLGGPARALGLRTAALFYDAIPLRFAELYLPGRGAMESYLRRLEAHREFGTLLCISEFAAAEAGALIRPRHSAVIHAGLSERFAALSSGLAGEEIEQAKSNTSEPLPSAPFALFVGGQDPRKNLDLVIDAFAKLGRKARRASLAVAGGMHPELADGVRARWRAAGLEPRRLILEGQVTDDRLVALYRGAACLVQPSFMEGFGLTLLEAAACGTPVLAADAGALPEVAGGSDGLFDPRDADALAGLLASVFSGGDAGADVSARARDGIGRYSWAATADRAAEAFAALIEREPAEPLSASALAAKAAARAKASGIDRALAAALLAHALPNEEDAAPRTFWDVTETAKSPHVTGIQRVVRNIAARVSEESGQQLVSGADATGFAPVSLAAGAFTVDGARRVDPGPGDTAVMLDSSWLSAADHQRELARLRRLGGEVFRVVYDLVPLRVPGFADAPICAAYAEWFEAALAETDGFICISRAVAEELDAFLDGIGFNAPLRIGYWHLGSDLGGEGANSAPEPEPERETRTGPLRFLMVGTLEPRKGHAIALQGFAAARAAGLEAELVVAGRQGWLADSVRRELELAERLGGAVRWEEGPDDAALDRLYREADAVICASHAEGFGLPLVEAAARGCRVIASDLPVFREVGAVADADFFEAGDPDALAKALLAFRRRSARPAAQAPLSWNESADRLQGVVRGADWLIRREGAPPARRQSASRGALAMTGRVEPMEKDYALELLQTPVPEDDGSVPVYLRLRKHTPGAWSSSGPEGGVVGGVRIGARHRRGPGAELEDAELRADIPYAVVPGLDFVFRLSVPAGFWARGGTLLAGLLQEGERWWPGAVEIPMGASASLGRAHGRAAASGTAQPR